MPLISSALVLLAGVALGGADVRLKGYYGDKLDRLIANQIAATDVDYLTAPFRMGAHRYGSQRVDVHFCDFASAGNTWEHDDAYRVWLPFEYSPKCD